MSVQVTILKDPLYGSVFWNGNDFVYTPNRGFVGRDFYVYSITDNGVSRTLTNYVETTNLPPSAGNISLTADAGHPVDIDVSGYVADPDTLIYPLTISNVSPPSYGNVSAKGTVITYQSYGFNSSDFFTYTISDGQNKSIGEVRINNVNGNDLRLPDYVLLSLSTLEADMSLISLLSANWESTYATVCANSAIWNLIDAQRYDRVSTVVENNSANWNSVASKESLYDSAVTVLSANSAQWNSFNGNFNDILSILSSNSANWNSDYSIVVANSSNWNDAYTQINNLNNIVSANSANWDGLYVTVQTSSANWDNTIAVSILSANSANWDSAYNDMLANSANWDQNTIDINNLISDYSSNSANWMSTYNIVSANSANWGDMSAYTILTANSANWNSVANNKSLYDDAVNTLQAVSSDWEYVKVNFVPLQSILSSSSANWDSGYNILQSNSGIWNDAYTQINDLNSTVSANSANWNDVYNTVQNNSASWDNTIAVSILSSNSANWNDSYNLVVANSATWDQAVVDINNLTSDYTSNSGNWMGTYNVVQTNSATWGTGLSYSILVANSANWNSVANNQSLYDSAVATVSSLSGDWEFVKVNFVPVQTILSSSSANWDNTFTTVQANSTNWNSAVTGIAQLNSEYNTNSAVWETNYNFVTANSASWDKKSTITTLQVNSGNWTFGYNTVSANSANWDSTYTILNTISTDYGSNSGNWDNTYLFVQNNSAGWGDSTVYSLLTSSSSNWDSAYTIVSANSSIWNNLSSSYVLYDSSYMTLTANSGNWDLAFTEVNSNSGLWGATSNLIQAYSARWLSGGTDVDITTNNLYVSGNAVFFGNLTAEGTTTQLNTNIVATSSFRIENTGLTPALIVNKTLSTGAIADFRSNSSSVLYISPLSAVGINTSTPNEALTVYGNISASGYILGNLPAGYTVFQNNSAKYEQSYSYVNANSATISPLLTSKSSYDTAYTYVNSNSATINSSLTAKTLYDNAYNVVVSQSATNNSSYTFLTANSASVGIDTVYRANSSGYDAAYNYFLIASANNCQINFLFDGGGSTVPVGSVGIVQIPTNINILSWTLLADVVTNAQIEVRKTDFDSYPVVASLAPTLVSYSDTPYLSASLKSSNSTLTHWTTSVSANSLLQFYVASNTAANSITMSLKCVKV